VFHGLLLGTAAELLYHCKFTWQDATLSIGYVVVALSLVAAVFLSHSHQDYEECWLDRTIRDLGYRLVYVPFYSNRPTPDRPLPLNYTAAIPPLSKVTAKTSFGTLVITSGKGLSRTYSWSDGTRSVELVPQRTWRGRPRLIAFSDRGENWPGFNCLELGGATSIHVWEWTDNFNGAGPALSTIQSDGLLPCSYNRSGLVVSWSKPGTVDLHAIVVVVKQILINGKKPDDLLGGDDSKVKVEPL